MPIQHIYSTLNTALEWAVRQRHIARNPMEDVDRPHREDKEMKIWTADMLSSFPTQSSGHRLYPLHHLTAFTGMRRSELLGLRWDAIDLDGAKVSVRRVEGGDPIRFHDLRHTHASLLAQSIPVIDVARRLGDTPATIMSTCAHVIPGRGEKVAAAFADLVAPGV